MSSQGILKWKVNSIWWHTQSDWCYNSNNAVMFSLLFKAFMDKHVVTVERRNSSLTGGNLQQDQAHCGRLSHNGFWRSDVGKLCMLTKSRNGMLFYSSLSSPENAKALYTPSSHSPINTPELHSSRLTEASPSELVGCSNNPFMSRYRSFFPIPPSKWTFPLCAYIQLCWCFLRIPNLSR